jgi:DNA-binding CsgD family transcriptional regulator
MPKTLISEHGEVRIETPRDRAGTFEPQIVRKRQRRFEGFDDKILALYSRGLSTRDIEAHLEEMPSVAAEPYAAQIEGDWLRATEFWTHIGCPYEAALAQADGDDEDALLHALVQLQKLEARPAARVVTRRLHARGVRGLPRGSRPTTRRNPAGLTRRELEVLALLTDGLRNGEIAARLYLSVKTVDHHVGAILRKLDVRSRAEAVRIAVAQDLLGTAG